MAYESTGMQALFPIYLSRMARDETPRDEYDVAVAQNEVNLNQNLESLCRKIIEIEAYLSEGQA